MDKMSFQSREKSGYLRHIEFLLQFYIKGTMVILKN